MSSRSGSTCFLRGSDPFDTQPTPLYPILVDTVPFKRASSRSHVDALHAILVGRSGELHSVAVAAAHADVESARRCAAIAHPISTRARGLIPHCRLTANA